MLYNNTLNIMQWNAQGITTFEAAAQLSQVLNKEKIDIVLLSETMLKEQHKLFLNGYKIYRRDREANRGGGVAIAIKTSIKHHALPEIKTVCTENISISVDLNGKKLIITSAYCPKYQPGFDKDIKKLTNPRHDFLVGGDFNAHNSAWNCVENNSAGNILNGLQLQYNFMVYFPNSPTHFPNSGTTPSTIDLMLTNSTAYISQPLALDELMSDHSPVIYTIDACATKQSPFKVPDFSAANWKKFQEYLDANLDPNADFNSSEVSTQSIDDALEKLTAVTIEAKNISIPLIARKGHGPKLSADTLACINHRNILKRNWQRCTNVEQKRNYKAMLNHFNKHVTRLVLEDRNEKWADTLSKMQPGDKKLWRICKTMKGKGSRNIGKLQNDTSEIMSNEDKANAIADSFEKAHRLTSDYQHSIDKKVNRLNKKIAADSEPNTDASTYTSPQELKTIIKNLKSTKAPGVDGIQNTLLKKLSCKSIVLLTKILNGCLKIGYFPASYKIAKVLPIAKPGKDPKLTTSYRPISLLSCLGKLFERVILARILRSAEENGIVAKEQFGFRAQHSTVHQVRRITKLIRSNKRRRLSTGMVLLDIEKAFDSVWHNGLIYKLDNANIPKYLTKLIQSFVSNRQFHVTVNGKVSTTRSIPAGLPQGSVLSPILYSIYTSDFKKPKYCEIGYYADDTSIICTGKLTSAIIKRL